MRWTDELVELENDVAILSAEVEVATEEGGFLAPEDLPSPMVADYDPDDDDDEDDDDDDLDYFDDDGLDDDDDDFYGDLDDDDDDDGDL